MPLSEVRRPQGCGFGLWGHNPMLAIPVDTAFSLPFSPNVVFLCLPRALTTASPRSYRRKVISHSDGHSIVRSAHCPPTNQSGIYFRFERSKFCKLSANDKKSRYTAHQISGRKSLTISLMKLCTGSEIQKPLMSAFSVPQADAATGAAQPQSLSAAALCFIQIFNCGSLMRAHRLHHIERLFVKHFPPYCDRKDGCRFRQPPLG